MAQGPSDTILVAIRITLRIRESKIRIFRIAVFGGGLFSLSASSFNLNLVDATTIKVDISDDNIMTVLLLHTEDAMVHSRWRKQIGMIDDHDECEWVNVSSGTGLPGLSRTNFTEL